MGGGRLAAVFAVCYVFTQLLPWLYQDGCCRLSNFLVSFVAMACNKKKKKGIRQAFCGIYSVWWLVKSSVVQSGSAGAGSIYTPKQKILSYNSSVCRCSCCFDLSFVIIHVKSVVYFAGFHISTLNSTEYPLRQNMFRSRRVHVWHDSMII